MIKIIPYFADFCICLAVSLKPDLFEGMRFDFTKGLNQKFFLTHRFLSSSCVLMHSSEILTLLFVYLSRLFWPPISVFMGPTTIPSQSPETIKIPTANYEFGATFIDHPKVGSRHHDYLFKTSSESGGSIIFVFYCLRVNFSVPAFWEGNDWWKTRCESEVRLEWQFHYEG